MNLYTRKLFRALVICVWCIGIASSAQAQSFSALEISATSSEGKSAQVVLTKKQLGYSQRLRTLSADLKAIKLVSDDGTLLGTIESLSLKASYPIKLDLALKFQNGNANTSLSVKLPKISVPIVSKSKSPQAKLSAALYIQDRNHNGCFIKALKNKGSIVVGYFSEGKKFAELLGAMEGGVDSTMSVSSYDGYRIITKNYDKKIDVSDASVDFNGTISNGDYAEITTTLRTKLPKGMSYGDIDRNNIVNFKDGDLLVTAIHGGEKGLKKVCSDCNFSAADFDGDRTVGFNDLDEAARICE